jgi:peptidyl-prolyl cis-trans isomerase D
MLAIFRRHLNSWPARVFFLLLVATFVLWGVGDVARNAGGGGTALAVVDGQKIQLPEVEAVYRRQLAQMAQMLGGKLDATPAMKSGIAGSALDQLITQAAVSGAVKSMGLAVSTAALRQAIADIPNFHGQNGQFDQATYEAVLRDSNMTEPQLLAILRAQIGSQELMGAARAGIASPDTLTRAVFDYQQERRVAAAVSLPFAAAPVPPPPDAAALHRWYDNNKDSYQSPEYRRIKAVLLSPDTVAQDVTITDAELQAAYQARKSEYVTPEKRGVEVLLVPDEARAHALAAQWAAGADWATMQKLPDVSPVELNDAAEPDFPAPELGRAVFSAPAGVVAAPVHSALGWHVFKVTAIVPGTSKSFTDVRAALRRAVLADKAANLVDDDANKVQDALSGGAALDDLPGNLGLAAVTGTLDAQGDTPEGKPAPIPGSPALRKALIAAAFKMKKGDPAELADGPKDDPNGQGYFAVIVQDVIPPAPKPYDAVAGAVEHDWMQDQLRREQNEAATAMLVAVTAGKTLEQAAAPRPVDTLPPVGRGADVPGVPAPLVGPLFTLKQGEPTMVETPDGFTVAVLQTILPADPAADPIGYSQLRAALAKTLGDDVQTVLTTALRDRAQPRVKTDAINSIVQAN